jgi:hypothetical protein
VVDARMPLLIDGLHDLAGNGVQGGIQEQDNQEWL